MKRVFNTDDELIEAIVAGGPQRQAAIRFLYNRGNLRHRVIQFVKANSGNEQDGQDMFHEGIIVLDRNLRTGKFRGESSLDGYLYSICRFQWMNQIRKNTRVDLQEDNTQLDETVTDNPESLSMDAEKKAILERVLTQLGERCQKILSLWKLNYSMQEIADQLGFSSAAMATKNKYKCHKSLLKFLEEHPRVMAMLQP